MHIRVVHVAGHSGGLDITLAHPWFASPEGHRAERLILQYIDAGYSSKGPQLSLGYGRGPNGHRNINPANIPEINTLGACQRLMDAGANTPIVPKFSPVEVHAYPVLDEWGIHPRRKALARELETVTSMRQLRRGKRGGLTYWMQMYARLNLPATRRDSAALEAATQAVAYAGSNDDPYQIVMNAALQGELGDVNPWKLAGEWRTAVRRLVA